MKNKKHLDYIRQLPCACCLRDKSDQHRAPHHLLRGVVRGLSMKAGDQFVIPLCHDIHHPGLHQAGDEETYLAQFDIKDPVSLAKELWRVSGNPTEGRRAIIRSKRP